MSNIFFEKQMNLIFESETIISFISCILPQSYGWVFLHYIESITMCLELTPEPEMDSG